jgi:type IV pilus assembly protein PilB
MLFAMAQAIFISNPEKFTRIRNRIDGVLFELMQPVQMHPAIVSRIKIMSNLDISERNCLRTAKFPAIVGGKSVDLRVSVLPTSNGEKVVIRVLESRSIMGASSLVWSSILSRISEIRLLSLMGYFW